MYVNFELNITSCTDLINITYDFSKNGYRLPTEAEWEYACRAGNVADYYWGNDTSKAGNYAWYYGNSNQTTHPVAAKLPNAFGLYDMSGNVWEWCNDWWDSTYSSSSQINNPTGPTNGTYRIRRGGSWPCVARLLRLAYRYGKIPLNYDLDVGFRCVRSAQ
jgi:formylglycine-generating enzyme required for sulfatase activity